MDYETQSLHQLRILAKDRANFGRINSATTGILIKVQDIEDESPEFVSVPSITRITEDVPTFTEVRLLFLFYSLKLFVLRLLKSETFYKARVLRALIQSFKQKLDFRILNQNTSILYKNFVFIYFLFRFWFLIKYFSIIFDEFFT